MYGSVSGLSSTGSATFTQDSPGVPAAQCWMAVHCTLQAPQNAFDVWRSTHDWHCGVQVEAAQKILRAVYGTVPELRDAELYRANPRASPFDIARTERRVGWIPSTSWPELLRAAGLDGETS